MMPLKVLSLLLVFSAIVSVLGTCDLKKCPPFPKHYEELECKPIIKDGECCPWSFDCGHLDVRDSKKCHFRGKELSEGDEIDNKMLLSSCIGAAHCSENGFFNHAHIDCVEFFGPPLQQDCIRQYSRESCCSVGTVCGDEVKNLTTCEFEGKIYKEGERMYPEDFKCHKCFCTKDFQNKPVLENKDCVKSSCQLELLDAESIRNKCAPVYHADSCCPYDWRCPKNGDGVIPGEKSFKFANETSSRCKFGKLEFQIGDTLSSSEKACSKCTCTSPPWLHCVFTPGC